MSTTCELKISPNKKVDFCLKYGYLNLIFFENLGNM